MGQLAATSSPTINWLLQSRHRTTPRGQLATGTTRQGQPEGDSGGQVSKRVGKVQSASGQEAGRQQPPGISHFHTFYHRHWSDGARLWSEEAKDDGSVRVSWQAGSGCWGFPIFPFCATDGTTGNAAVLGDWSGSSEACENGKLPTTAASCFLTQPKPGATAAANTIPSLFCSEPSVGAVARVWRWEALSYYWLSGAHPDALCTLPAHSLPTQLSLLQSTESFPRGGLAVQSCPVAIWWQWVGRGELTMASQ